MFVIVKAILPSQADTAPDPAPQVEEVIVADPPQLEVAAPEPEPDLRLGLADRRDEARRYAQLGKSMRLVDPERPHISHLVGPDISNPATWRHSELVDDRPFSDLEFQVVEDAFLSALQAGGVPAHAAGAEDPGPAGAFDLDEPMDLPD